MFILPFIFFSLLTYFLYKRQEGVTVAVYLSALYAITALCAAVTILCGFLGEETGILFDNSNAEFGFLPTLFYCALLAASIWPFTRFNTTKIRATELVCPWALDALGVLLIILSLINLYLVADSTLDILDGNFAELRQSVYDGEESAAQIKAMSIPGMYYIFPLNIITIFALPLAFYNITRHRCTWWFNGLLLFASLAKPIAAVQTADRTEIAFFGIMTMFTLVMFWREITLRTKITLGIIAAPIVAAMAIYVSAVTSDRFEKTYAGPAASAMQYIGQGYINFCYIWEHANSDYISTEREFPLYNRIFTGIVSDGDRRNVRSAEHGFFISVFPSFIGDILLDLTLPGLILWLLVYIVICNRFIPDTEDPDRPIYAADYLIVFMLGIIPAFGIFYYRFFSFQSTIMIMCIIAASFFSRYTFSFNAQEGEDTAD
ncbi:MAG: hypothetical protein J1F13_05490 [Prevotellaceae bacterium]|nr:hypothetical protein [Prevotellaceae bacterium]